MKEKIKAWYKFDLWTKEMVRNAVVKGKLTEDEYNEIVVDANISMNVVNASN